MTATSPLYLEVEQEAMNQAVQWYLVITYAYVNRIEFTGHPGKQDVVCEQI